MSNGPKFRAFTVNQYGNGPDRKTRWTEIGACWETQNGNLRVQLEAVPVNGTIVLLPPKQGDETQDSSDTDEVPEGAAVEA